MIVCRGRRGPGGTSGLNWLDITLLVIVALTLLEGLRAGFFRSVTSMAGLALGLYLAPRISGALEDKISPVVGSQSIAAAVAYVLVIVATSIAGMIVGNILRNIAGALLLGWTDRIAGALLGLIEGLLIGFAVIAVLARLAYLVPSGGSGNVVETRSNPESALLGSTFLPRYLDVRKALPSKAQAFMPGSFSAAMDELERRSGQGPKA